MTKVTIESPSFVETTQGDICGIIHLQLIWVIKVFCGFTEVSTRWSHVCVISIINVSFFFIIIFCLNNYITNPISYFFN